MSEMSETFLVTLRVGGTEVHCCMLCERTSHTRPSGVTLTDCSQRRSMPSRLRWSPGSSGGSKAGRSLRSQLHSGGGRPPSLPEPGVNLR
jgi:hypothetical protein